MRHEDGAIYAAPDEEQVALGISEVRARLWSLARDEATLARAAHALWGRPPEEDEWADLLDFVAVEWIDDAGRTLAETLAHEPGLHDLGRWPTEVHTALFVVDGHREGGVRVRDLADDRERLVRVPPGAEAELTRKTVLRARVVPWNGALEFFGEPAIYGEQGVLARLTLLAQWREGPEPSLLVALAERRAAFALQRDQRRVWLDQFGEELVVFPDADTMEAALDTYFERLLTQDRGPRGDRPTRAEARLAATGKPAESVHLRLGDTLREGRPALLFDDAAGAWFLPAFGELQDHLHGRADHPAVLDLWLGTPDLPRLALRRAGPTARIAAHLGREDAPLDELLGPDPRAGELNPSPLPEYPEP